jgi:DNA-binding transcriptional LysR family regulator
VQDVAGGKRGVVRLGVSATMAAIYLPQLLRRLATDLPDLRITIINGMNDVLRAGLRNGDLDAVLGVYDHDDRNTEGFVIARDEVCVVAAVGHRLQKRRIAVADLIDERWVLPSRAVKMRQWLDAAFTARNLTPPDPHIETTSIAILETLIADSDFVSFVSSWKVGTRLSRNRLAALDVPELRMPREFGLLWSAIMPPGPATATLTRYIRSALDKGE